MRNNRYEFFRSRPSAPAEIHEEARVLRGDPDTISGTVRTAEDDEYIDAPVYY